MLARGAKVNALCMALKGQFMQHRRLSYLYGNMLTHMDKIRQEHDKRSLCEDLTRAGLKLNCSEFPGLGISV